MEEQQAFSLQQHASAVNLGQSPYHQVSGMPGYAQAGGHQLPHLQYLPHTHPAFPSQLGATNQNLMDYTQAQSHQGNYQPNPSAHYPGSIHHGYHSAAEQYTQQQLAAYDHHDHQNALAHISPYYAQTGGVGIGPESAAAQGQNVAAQGYSSYTQQLQAQQHYSQNLSLDPNGQAGPYGQFHQHAQMLPNFQQTGVQPNLDPTSYMAMNAANQNPSAAFNPAYHHFGPAVPSVTNGHLAHYGILPSAAGGQLGILDTSNLTGTRPSQQITKSSIKNEDHHLDNEIHLMNSLGDSHSQNEDKLKVNQQILYQSYEHQQQLQAYCNIGQNLGIQKKDDILAQGGYFPAYPAPYVVGQQQHIMNGAHLASQLQNQASLALKEDPSKKQPNSPGRKKTIKKGSPTTEPTSPASPKGRNKKGASNQNIKVGEQPQQLESSSTLNPTILQQSQGFGLHLMKVPNQEHQLKPQLAYPGSYPLSLSVPLGQIGGLLIDQHTNQITGIDPAQLQRFKDLPHDFNMNDFGQYDDKTIGTITKEERKQKIKRYQEKRKHRSFTKKISYDVRKKVADSRLRVKGRFVTKDQAMKMLNLPGKGEQFTMDDLKEMLRQRGFQPTGGDDGDEESKSPTLMSRNSKKHLSMPGTVQSLKQGDDDDEEDDGVNSLDNVMGDAKKKSAGRGILRGKSSEEIQVKQADCFSSTRIIEPQQQQQQDGIRSSHNQEQQFFQNIIHNSNTMHNGKGGQLLLKLEQKDTDIKHQGNMFQQNQQAPNSGNGVNYQMNAGLQQQQQQQQQQPHLMFTNNNSQSSSSQSPSRSPTKKVNLSHQSSLKVNDGANPQQVNNLELNGDIQSKGSLILQPSLQSIQSDQGDNNNGLGGNSINNIQSQDITDRFLNLNIKSPDQKHQVFASQQNPSLLNLTDSQTGLPVQHSQLFFANLQNGLLQQNQMQPQNQNYVIYQQQQQQQLQQQQQQQQLQQQQQQQQLNNLGFGIDQQQQQQQ